MMRISTALAAFLLLTPFTRGAAPDFETDVLPVLTKSGCNTGACHGAAIGRGGFRLSLLGYDPDLDYESIVHEYQGRRINMAKPERSLLLRKPTLQVEHEGGHKL
ncbi:MAG: S-layer protein, partial [Gemmataceae bacterium]